MASITREGGMLVYESDYDEDLVEAIKAEIPRLCRRWDEARQVWLVDPRHGRTLVRLTDEYLGENIGLPAR